MGLFKNDAETIERRQKRKQHKKENNTICYQRKNFLWIIILHLISINLQILI